MVSIVDAALRVVGVYHWMNQGSQLYFRLPICQNAVPWHGNYESRLREPFATSSRVERQGGRYSRTWHRSQIAMLVSTMPFVVITTSLRRLAAISGFTSPRSARLPSDRLLGVENKALTTLRAQVCVAMAAIFMILAPGKYEVVKRSNKRGI
jgi:hypothetical protein